MYNGNKTYRKKMLQVLDDDIVAETFGMSSPSKISKRVNKAFSMPAGPDFSCPGATEACVGCYAQKGRHNFGNVQRAFARNWNVFLEYESRNDEVGCALELNKYMPKEGIFRIHESGDFHSQFAVNVWGLVVANNPHVDFYTYTRTFDLDFAPLISHDNMVLWASTDPYNKKVAKEFVRRNKAYSVRHAYGPWEHNQALPKDSFVCPVTSGKLAVEGACDKCKLCVLPNRAKKHVVFYAH